MYDEIIKVGKSIIQHGPNNDRVYLMKLHPEDLDVIVNELGELAKIKGYSKIFTKVPEWALDNFLASHFKVEASVPYFYQGKTKAYFVSKFLDTQRSYLPEKEKAEISNIVDLSSNHSNVLKFQLPLGYTIERVGVQEAKYLAKLYKSVFEVYPFPIFNEKYIIQTMSSDVRYFGVYKNGKLVAASSAEMDVEGENAEMTDFATHQDHLGNNLSYFLLQHMEAKMREVGIKTAFTIARAKSFGMNKTFGRSQYSFGGTLVNNTQIGSSIESMNVWYKNLHS